MDRFWGGLAILLALLVLCSGVSMAMEAIHAPVARQLQQAVQAADREDWETANALAEQARARWKQYWIFTAAVADHTPMDELDGLFAELLVYLEHQEQPHFSATGRHLAELARSMAESHKPFWWNLI